MTSHLFFASDNQTLTQYGWQWNDTQWTYQGAIPGIQGHTGIGCTTSGTKIYIFVVNQDQQLEAWVKELDDTIKDHIVNEWKNMTINWIGISVPLLQPASSFAFRKNLGVLFAQDNHGIFTIYQLNFDSGDWLSVDVESQSSISDYRGIPNTRLVTNYRGTNSTVEAYFQVTEGGNRIAHFTQNVTGSQVAANKWQVEDVPLLRY